MATQKIEFSEIMKSHNQKDFDAGKYKYIKKDFILETEEVRSVSAEVAEEAKTIARQLNVPDLIGGKSLAANLYVLDRGALRLLEENEATKKFVAGKKTPHAFSIVMSMWNESNKEKKFSEMRPILVAQAVAALASISVSEKFKSALMPTLFEYEVNRLAEKEGCKFEELGRGQLVYAKQCAERSFKPLTWALAEILTELEQAWVGKQKDAARYAERMAKIAAQKEAQTALTGTARLFANALSRGKLNLENAREFGEDNVSNSSTPLSAEENGAMGAFASALTDKKPARARSARATRPSVDDAV